MTPDTAAPELVAIARDVLDRTRHLVLGTTDEDGSARTSPSPSRSTPPDGIPRPNHHGGTT